MDETKIYCEHSTCETILDPDRILKCRHYCCQRCYRKAGNTCAVCEESTVNKVLVPMMHRLYDYYAVLKGVKDTSILFSKENIHPPFELKAIERMMDLSWKVNSREKLEKFIAIWNSYLPS